MGFLLAEKNRNRYTFPSWRICQKVAFHCSWNYRKSKQPNDPTLTLSPSKHLFLNKDKWQLLFFALPALMNKSGVPQWCNTFIEHLKISKWYGSLRQRPLIHSEPYAYLSRPVCRYWGVVIARTLWRTNNEPFYCQLTQLFPILRRLVRNWYFQEFL